MSERTAAAREPGVGMLCPICAVDLVMSERQGVEIDYCPKCRGIWLDRGEVEKIIERSLGQWAAPGNRGAAPAEPAYPPPQGWAGGHDGGGHHGGGHHGSHRGYGRHGRKSWLSEIFD